MPPLVPFPPSRKAPRLPWLAVTLGTLGGLALLVFLWNVMVDLQLRAVPPKPAQTFEAR